MRLHVLFTALAILWSLAPCGEEGQVDAVVEFTDGSIDTVSNVWEYYERQPVRRLCYIDGKDRPQIPYAEISTISFARSDENPKMVDLTIVLHDGRTKHGRLWFNDSFFGTRKDGTEWRGVISSLRRMTFLPKPERAASPAPTQGPSRSGRGSTVRGDR